MGSAPWIGDELYPVKTTTSVLAPFQQSRNLNASGHAYRISGIAYLRRYYPLSEPEGGPHLHPPPRGHLKH